MKIFERIKRKYTNGDPSSEEKTGIQKKRIPYGYTFYPVLWNGGKYAVNLLLGVYGYMYVYAYIYEYREKKSFLKGHNGKFLFNAGEISMQDVAPSDIPPDLNSEKALSLLYPNIIMEAFAIYGADLHNRSWLNEEEKKAAEWDGVIDAVQDSSSRRERLEKRLIYLKDYLQKYDGVSEQIYNSFSKEITEIEEELGKLGG